MNHDPSFLAALFYGSWALTVFAYGCWWLSAMKNAQRQLVLFWVLTVVCLLIASPIALYADQPVMNPCTACAGLGPSDWEYWIFMCWSCP